MDTQRLILLLALGLVIMLIWDAWQREHRPPPQAPAVQAPAPSASDKTAAVPTAPAASAPPPAAAQAPAPAPRPLLARGTRVTVATDLLRAEVDARGGDLRVVDLLQYPVSLEQPDVPFRLLNDDPETLYVAQSGLIGRDRVLPNHNTVYRVDARRVELPDGADHVDLPLTWRAPDGVEYTKVYRFYRDHYYIDLRFEVNNRSTTPWQGFLYAHYLVKEVQADNGGIMGQLPIYYGGALYSPENKFEKIPFDKMREERLLREVQGGWVAMLRHYFVSAWLPPAERRQQFYSESLGDGLYRLGHKGLQAVAVPPGQRGVLATRLYAGPKEQDRLAGLAEGLVLTVDYGWLTPIAQPLFWVLKWLHRLVGNWGWAIVLLTVLIKLAFYPLSATSYKSMAKMRKLTPRMQSLKERYGDDKQKLQQAMMELYKKEKINPMGGCLPILIQIPVFIALYWVLLESVELRQAPFVLWIRDLSARDPYFVLPILMGISMFVQQWLSPNPATDPLQRKLFMALPAVFTVFFLFFPSGLVLYWLVNNVLSIAQQWRITQVIEAKG